MYITIISGIIELLLPHFYCPGCLDEVNYLQNVYFVKLGNKNLENDVKVKLLILVQRYEQSLGILKKDVVKSHFAMKDVLTSGDLHVGHIDLGQPMLVDPTETNINTPEIAK